MGKFIVENRREDGSVTYFIARTHQSFWLNTLYASSAFWMCLLLGLLLYFLDKEPWAFAVVALGTVVFIWLEYVLCIREVGVIVEKEYVTVRHRIGRTVLNRQDGMNVRAKATDPPGHTDLKIEAKHYLQFDVVGREKPVMVFFDLNAEQVSQVRDKLALELRL